MRFGVFFLGSTLDGNHKRTYDAIIDQASYAEQLGFDSVWLAEHHNARFGTLPSPPVMAAAIAERTRRVRIGVGVALLPFLHPVRTAEEYAMLDVISGGRLNFGAGRGYAPPEYRMFGVDLGASRELTRESLEIIVGLWSTPGPFSYRGNHFQLDNVELTPRPVQQSIPVWAAASSAESFELYARSGLQVLASPRLREAGPGQNPLADAKAGMLRAAHVLVEQGRDPESIEFPLSMLVHVAPTLAEAKRNVRGHLEWLFRELTRIYENDPEVMKRIGEPPRLEGLIEAGTVIVGDPEYVRTIIRGLRHEVGLKHLLCSFHICNLDHADVKRTMRLFADEVMAELRSEPAPPLPFVAHAG